MRTQTHTPGTRHPSRAMRVARPIVASNPISGERAIMMTAEHQGVAYLCALEWSRHDDEGQLEVSVSPDPLDARALLKVLVALNSLLWAQRDRAQARSDPATPTRADAADVALWEDAAHRLLVYRIAMWEELFAEEERRAEKRPLDRAALVAQGAVAPRTPELLRRVGR